MGACKRTDPKDTAFYYWKTTFDLSAKQKTLLRKTNTKAIYIRYFDVKWNDLHKRSYPEAVVRFDQGACPLPVIPVIYITNKTFEKMPKNGIDSLAFNCVKLVTQLSSQQKFRPVKLQVDCDWTLKTRDAYFTFLAAIKKRSKCTLEATIRLHQIKYAHLTGVPPVDRGVLMFYNMGKLNANLKQTNSIYNGEDAGHYLRHLKAYPLSLDVALPIFSWAIQIRNGRMIQVYQKLDRMNLENLNFEKLAVTENAFRAKKSFYLLGIYIKQNDIFKVEETNAQSLEKAASQLAKNLPEDSKRTIIYYELANIDTTIFRAETIRQVSACF
ncbi:hypothetical protein GCM10011425_29780 [Mucilaginibacter galii]|uniref:Uncharacterized protein n=2 Tax=Mucilaginibacter galii TaxID=2005073 RepID=A0A917JAQ8_9SPHI|nr:hypothetical protein GCM10011425_29780 [Mucilaginibacter galii]